MRRMDLLRDNSNQRNGFSYSQISKDLSEWRFKEMAFLFWPDLKGSEWMEIHKSFSFLARSQRNQSKCINLDPSTSMASSFQPFIFIILLYFLPSLFLICFFFHWWLKTNQLVFANREIKIKIWWVRFFIKNILYIFFFFLLFVEKFFLFCIGGFER